MAITLNDVSGGTFRKHYALLLDGIDPNVDLTAVDLSNEVKQGATMVLLHIDAESSGGAHLVAFYGDSGAGASDEWGHAL